MHIQYTGQKKCHHTQIQVSVCVFFRIQTDLLFPHSRCFVMCYKLPLNSVLFTWFFFLHYFSFARIYLCSSFFSHSLRDSFTLNEWVLIRSRRRIMLETMFCMQINHYPRHTHTQILSMRSTSLNPLFRCFFLCFDYDETHVKRRVV